MNCPGRPALTSGPPAGWGYQTQTEAHRGDARQASETRKVVSQVETVQDVRPARTTRKAKHTITIEPYTQPGLPEVTHAVVERFGHGFTKVCARNTDLRPGTTLEYTARRLAALYDAQLVEIPNPAAGYTKERELPADVVDVGDQVARVDAGGSNFRWSTVTWVDDCRGEFCPQVPGVCGGVLGFADGTEEHYDVVDRPTVRIPCEVAL